MAGLTAALGILVLSPPGALASTALPANVGAKHVMWGAGQSYPSTQQASANNLIYHGGLVETVPAVYIVYWGPEWQQGFSFTQGGFTYTNNTVKRYIQAFFGNVGGSPWAGVQTQYCQTSTRGSRVPGSLLPNS